jgi:hypothetical protein
LHFFTDLENVNGIQDYGYTIRKRDLYRTFMKQQREQPTHHGRHKIFQAQSVRIATNLEPLLQKTGPGIKHHQSPKKCCLRLA